MSLALYDRVRETTTVLGTNDAVLLGAVSGYQSFAAVGNANTCYYTISDSAGNWEVGLGTYNTTGPTLARTTVYASSNSNLKVNFPAGTKDIFLTYPSEKAVALDTTSSIAAGSMLYGNGTTSFTSLPVGTNGYLLQSNGTAPTWVAQSTLSIGTATNLAGGATGSVPYQSASGTTTFLAAGTNGQVLTLSGGLPTWANNGNGTVTSVDVSGGTTGLTTSGGPITSSGTITLAGTLNVANGGTGLTSLTAGSMVYGAGTSAYSTLAIGAANTVLTSSGTAPQYVAQSTLSVGTATNLAGGLAGSVPYQSGAGATTFLGIGTNGYILQSNGTAPTWVNPTTVVGGAGGANTQVQYNNSGALAGSANMTFNGTSLTLANDATIHGLTVGLGGGAVAGNTVVGNTSLASNSGTHNSAFGWNVLPANTTGSDNSGFGFFALNANVGGNKNSAFGSGSLFTNSSGLSNSAFGYNALNTNSTGSNNIAVGDSALYSNNASNNTAVGYQAGYSNTTGTLNTFIGVQAGYANSTGSGLVAVGNNALQNTNTDANTAVGYYALNANATGQNNVALGQYALLNSNSSNNTGIGQGALLNATGSYNTVIGANSGNAITSGFQNTILGCFTGNGGGLDIRTANNYIVLSDGAGNPRVVVPTGTGQATVPNATGTVMVSGNMPAFSATASAAQSFPQNTGTVIAFDTEVFDTNSNYNTTTYAFTPTVAGYYQFNVIYGLENPLVNSNFGLDFFKNGAFYVQVFNGIQVNGFGLTVSGSSLIYMNGTTDYVQAVGFPINGTSSVNGRGTIAGYTEFSAVLVRSA